MMFWIMVPATFVLGLKMVFWGVTVISCLEKRDTQKKISSWGSRYTRYDNSEQVAALNKADELLMTFLSPIQQWTYCRFGYFNEWRYHRRYRFFGYFYTGGVNEYWLGFIPITGWCITWGGYYPGYYPIDRPPSPDLTLARLLYLRAHKTFHGNRDVAIAQPPIPAG